MLERVRNCFIFAYHLCLHDSESLSLGSLWAFFSGSGGECSVVLKNVLFYCNLFSSFLARLYFLYAAWAGWGPGGRGHLLSVPASEWLIHRSPGLLWGQRKVGLDLRICLLATFGCEQINFQRLLILSIVSSRPNGMFLSSAVEFQY